MTIVIMLVAMKPALLFSYNFDSNAYIEVKKADAELIFKTAISDSLPWERLAYMCDTYGPRLTGSSALEKAINWAEGVMKSDGLKNVHKEKVIVPHWVRGKEYCRLIEPRSADLRMTGLGRSIGTPEEGITAPVLVVKSFVDLQNKSNLAKGKIVVYDIPFKSYGQSVQYRTRGAIEAARYGAVASLTRSASPFTMGNAHTGAMRYVDSIPKIPHAALSIEDVQLLARMQARGQKPVLKLFMQAKTMPDTISHNLIAEIKGSERPEEILTIGGHIDSWDVGSGAQDDASGSVTAWMAVKLLKDLGLKPKRTIRLVLWTNEEYGLKGGYAYYDKHKDEIHALGFEFDSGVFPPHEIRYTGSDEMLEIVKSWKPLFKIINDSLKIIDKGGGADVSPLQRAGVPTMSLNTDDQGKYFWYHHSQTDTPDKIDPYEMNRCVAAMSLAVYLYADLPIELPNQFHHGATK